MKSYRFLFLLSLLFISCSKGTNESEALDPSAFRNTTVLKGEILPEPIMIKSEAGVFFYTKRGLLCTTSLEDPMYILIDNETGKELMSAGRHGKGPGEFITPLHARYDWPSDSFYLNDFAKDSIYSFTITNTSIVQENIMESRKKEYPAVNGISKITDSTYFFINGGYADKSTLNIIDKDWNFYYSEENIILPYDDLDFSKNYYSSIFQINRNRNTLLITDTHLPYIRVYNINDNQLELRSSRKYLEWRYTITKEKWFGLDLKNQKFGYAGLISDNYIYILNFNMTWAEILSKKPIKNVFILVFDYDCNHITTLRIDREIRSYEVSPDDRYLYAIIDDTDMHIIRYELPDFKNP